MAYPTPEQIDAAVPVDGEPSRALTNAALKSIVAESETKASTTDPRLADSRTPVGPAGGVLSGTYPNPSFAQEMATAAQLETKIDKAKIGASGGVAPLDEAGVVPLEHLNVSGLNFFGAWDASTNTPELVDGVGTVGDFGKVSVAGTQNFGNGAHSFQVGDWVIYAAGTWQRIGVHEAVASVNGKTGAVQLTAADVGALPDSYSPAWLDISGKPDFDTLYAPKPRGGFSAPVLAVSAGLPGAVDVASGVTKAITWATPSIDPFSMHNGTTGFVVPSWAVLARATLKMTMGPNPNGYRWTAIRLNGSDVHADRRNAIPATWTNLNLHSIAFPVTPGAVIDFTVFQNSGSEIGIADNAIFQIELYSLN